MAETTIQWCDHSINPIRARNNKTGAVGHYCEKIAAGCAACYSSAFQKRFGMPPFGAGQHREEVEIFLDKYKLEDVRRRKKPTKYFWCDMTDIFGDWMQPDWLAECFATMDATPQHTHLLLTKRPENIRRMWPDKQCDNCLEVSCGPHRTGCLDIRHRENVWLGTSISTQTDADRNIPHLLRCRDLSPVLFVSAEPLIEAVDIRPWLRNGGGSHCSGCRESRIANRGATHQFQTVEHPGDGIDWLIIGCESGPRARPGDVAWIRSLKDQCQAAGVACFVKQLGSLPVGGKQMTPQEWRLRDPKGGDPSEWPEDLRVREFPKV